VNSSAAAVDVDDQTTWPVEVRRQVAADVDQLTDVRDFGQLTGISAVRWRSQLLEGHTLRVFHATKLLKHELDDLAVVGLRPLTERLVDERLQKAAAAGELSAEMAEALAQISLLRVQDQREIREGMVSVVAGLKLLGFNPDSVTNQLTRWGGEVLNQALETSDPMSIRLRQIGTPALVIAEVQVSEDAVADDYQLDALYRAFVGTALGFAGVGAHLQLHLPIPGSQIEAVWTPGTVGYDQYDQLPEW
jgi:hypothetical protein